MTIDEAVLIIALVIVGAALGGPALTRALTLAYDRLSGKLQQPPTEAAPPASRLTPHASHVHTYALASTEQTAGHQVHVYRCLDCGQLQRWATHEA